MAISKNLRAAIYKRDGLRCRYCGCACLLPSETWQGNPRTATLDHVIASVNGGSDSRSNLVTACEECNGLKGCADKPIDRTPREIISGDRVRAIARQIVDEERAVELAYRALRRPFGSATT